MLKIPIYKNYFSEVSTIIFESEKIAVEQFKYPSGIEALKISNKRGYVIALPFFGQMIWDVKFDGIKIGMKSLIDQPIKTNNIAGTYGCYAFHSGILRNGCPSSQDSHMLHGEFPCAEIEEAFLEVHDDGSVILIGKYTHMMGFGNNYIAVPSIKIQEESGVLETKLKVKNIGNKPMELMYMFHINNAFFKNAKIFQPAPFKAEFVRVRKSIPLHLNPTNKWKEFLEILSNSPEKMEKLSEPEMYNPEFVFYISNLSSDSNNKTNLFLVKDEGDGCVLSYDKNEFNYLVRWILCDGDMEVGSLGLPSTCLPEGYLAEKSRGSVKIIEPHETINFTVIHGYLSADEMRKNMEEKC